ncbi:MAG: hypothetical protein Q7S31_02710 [bacterium]|nr:hypothetical protein [bacterium]
MDPLSLKNKLLTWLVALDLLVLNLGVGYLGYKAFVSSQVPPVTATVSGEILPDQCGPACQDYIDVKVAQLSGGRLATPRPTPTPTPTPRAVTSPVIKTTTVSYITVPGSGSTTANDWTTLPGTEFYFNPVDYPGLKEIYFEVNMKLTNGNGVGYVRLLDATHGIAVQGSDVQTSSQTDLAVVSGKVSFWSGSNLIRVQIKSLTADTTVYNSGRLRIVQEN